MRSRAALVALIAALASGVATAPAWAQPKDPQARYDSAMQAYDKKEFEAALAGFREAYSGSKSPNARLFIARCLRELGKVSEAYDEMKAVLDEATAKAAKESRYAPTRDAAARELAELERSIAIVTVTVEGSPDDIEVRIGPDLLPRDQLGRAVVRKPGKVTLRASSKGKKSIEREVDLVAGQRQTIALAFGDASQITVVVPQAPGPATPSTPADSGSAKGNIPLLASGIVVAVLGIGGGVTFAVTGSMAKSKFDDVESGCGGVRCTDPTYADVISSGRTLSTVANVSLGLGIAFVAAGAVMIGVGWPKGDSKGSASGSISIAAGPDASGFVWTLAF